MTEEVELAYMAGFFDGEGSVGIIRRLPDPKWGRRSSFALRTSVYNNDRRPLELFKQRFGGVIKTRKPRSIKHAIGFTYEANHAQAAQMAMALRPNCVIKAERLDLALSFYAAQQSLPNRGKCGRRGLPEDYLQLASDYHDRLIKLNERGPK